MRPSQERTRLEARQQHQVRDDSLRLALAPGVPLELVHIPAGEFLMGSSAADQDAYDDETPQRHVPLPDYWIGRFPVTVLQFDVFVRAMNIHTNMTPGEVYQRANHPVTLVSWDDAMSFCKWLSRLAGRAIRLPNEAEWEKAARGTDGRLWPWGNEVQDVERSNFAKRGRGTTPAGMFSPRGDSPYGCADMAGNVWEWTNSLIKPYPYRAEDGREEPGDLGMRVLRGGSFLCKPNRIRCAARLRQPPNNRYEPDIGFRICVPGTVGAKSLDK